MRSGGQTERARPRGADGASGIEPVGRPESAVRRATGRHRIGGPAADEASSRHKLEALLDAARDLSSACQPPHPAQAAADAVERALEGAAGAVARHDASSHRWTVSACGGRGAGIYAPIRTFAAEDAVFSADILAGRAVCRQHLRGPRQTVEGELAAAGRGSYVVMPIGGAQDVRGALLAAWDGDYAPAPEELRFLEILSLQLTLAQRAAALRDQLDQSGRALRAAKDQIGHASRLQALGQVASGVAHDFNNSLTAILGLSDWLLHELPPDAPYYADLETIRTAAKDAAAMVKRLQTFGRLRTDAARPRPAETLDLAAVARAVADLARPRCQELALHTGRTFEVVVDAADGPLARGSAAEVRELLVNLVFNGLDAMPQGGTVRLATRVRDGRPEVLVCDSGIGMTPEVQARIFEPFFSTKGSRGHGLGLSVCAGIAERHGADLSVDTVPGEGTTFVLAFPPFEAAPADDQDPPTVCPQPWTLSVLVVDDQPRVCDSLAAMASALGHSVTKASDGVSALDMVIDRPFDVVVTDLTMPGMDGIELARGVRACRPDTAVVLITAWGSESERTAEAGDVLVASKPVTMDGLRRHLADAHERRRSGRQGIRLVRKPETVR